MIVISGLSARFLRSLNATFNLKQPWPLISKWLIQYLKYLAMLTG